LVFKQTLTQEYAYEAVILTRQRIYQGGMRLARTLNHMYANYEKKKNQELNVLLSTNQAISKSLRGVDN